MKGIIFDFDGTLADTNEAIVRNYQTTFQQMGYPEPSAGQITPLIGLPSETIFRTLVPGIEDQTVADGVKLSRKLFYEVAIPYIKLFNGVKETLSSVVSKGIKTAVASSRNSPSLFYLLDYLELGEYFDDVTGVESVSHPKPAPDMAQSVLSKFGFRPEEVLVVGDTLFDLGMGKNAGCLTCGVTYGNHSREKLASAEPDWLIDSFPQLLDIIG